MKKHPKCDWGSCSNPGEHLGVMYQVLTGGSRKGRLNTKRITRPMCNAHYLENTFGLWPFHCTVKCYKAAQKRADIVLSPSDTTVWVDMAMLLGQAKPGKARPKCPWCGKPMQAGEAQDDKKKSVAKPKSKSMGRRSKRT